MAIQTFVAMLLKKGIFSGLCLRGGEQNHDDYHVYSFD
jgi:hypothetical protein